MAALSYCHDHPSNLFGGERLSIVHGNIRPENILVPKGSSFQNLILVNFDSAYIANDTEDNGTVGTSSCSSSFSSFGHANDTDAVFSREGCDHHVNQHSRPIQIVVPQKKKSLYHAPEMAQTGPTTQTDVWACGVLAFHLLTGHYPFPRTDDCFDPIARWYNIHDMACQKTLASMLNFIPERRATASDCAQSKWLGGGIPQQLSMETMMQLSKTRVYCRFRLAVQSYIASTLMNRSERKHYDQVFRNSDTNRDGVLSKTELSESMKYCFPPLLHEDALNTSFERIDLDHNATVEFSEFLTFAIEQDKMVETQKLKAAFQAFDVSRTGYITVGDLKEIFGAEDEEIVCYETVQNMIQTADRNGDGKISFEEFTDIMDLRY